VGVVCFNKKGAKDRPGWGAGGGGGGRGVEHTRMYEKSENAILRHKIYCTKSYFRCRIVCPAIIKGSIATPATGLITFYEVKIRARENHLATVHQVEFDHSRLGHRKARASPGKLVRIFLKYDHFRTSNNKFNEETGRV